MSTLSDMSSGIPISAPPPAADEQTVLRPASPCSSDSGSSSSSTSDSTKRSPTGVYVPMHRRAGSSPATSRSSSPRSSKTHFPLSNQSPPKPQRRSYTRDELLALAPTSLVHAALHPVVTPALVAKHPRILRTRGDGVARALDMARQDRDVQKAHFAYSQGAPAQARVGGLGQSQVQSNTPVLPPGLATPATPAYGTHGETMQMQTQTQTGNQQRRKRGGRRRAQYQRNFAAGSDSGSKSGSENANLNSNPNLLVSSEAKAKADARSALPYRRRQLDLTVLSSWRAPQAVA